MYLHFSKISCQKLFFQQRPVWNGLNAINNDNEGAALQIDSHDLGGQEITDAGQL